jgi:uncharacterized protein YegP (UPF0339 family)
MAWKFKVYRDAASQFRWRLVAPNGRITADSGQGYDSRSAAQGAAERVRGEIGGAAVEDE